jgi:hypothetical protein
MLIPQQFIKTFIQRFESCSTQAERLRCVTAFVDGVERYLHGMSQTIKTANEPDAMLARLREEIMAKADYSIEQSPPLSLLTVLQRYATNAEADSYQALIAGLSKIFPGLQIDVAVESNIEFAVVNALSARLQDEFLTDDQRIRIIDEFFDGVALALAGIRQALPNDSAVTHEFIRELLQRLFDRPNGILGEAAKHFTKRYETLTKDYNAINRADRAPLSSFKPVIQRQPATEHDSLWIPQRALNAFFKNKIDVKTFVDGVIAFYANLREAVNFNKKLLAEQENITPQISLRLQEGIDCYPAYHSVDASKKLTLMSLLQQQAPEAAQLLHRKLLTFRQEHQHLLKTTSTIKDIGESLLTSFLRTLEQNATSPDAQVQIIEHFLEKIIGAFRSLTNLPDTELFTEFMILKIFKNEFLYKIIKFDSVAESNTLLNHLVKILSPAALALFFQKISTDILNQIINHPAKTNQLTPLMIAVALGELEKMKVLINAGAQTEAIDCQREKSLTPEQATDFIDADSKRGGHQRTVSKYRKDRFTQDFGVESIPIVGVVKTAGHYSPVMIACLKKQFHALQFFIQNYAQRISLGHTISQGQAEARLIGFNELMVAIDRDSLDMVKLLLAQKVYQQTDLHPENKTYHLTYVTSRGWTALNYAARHRSFAITAAILQMDVPISQDVRASDGTECKMTAELAHERLQAALKKVRGSSAINREENAEALLEAAKITAAVQLADVFYNEVLIHFAARHARIEIKSSVTEGVNYNNWLAHLATLLRQFQRIANDGEYVSENYPEAGRRIHRPERTDNLADYPFLRAYQDGINQFECYQAYHHGHYQTQISNIMALILQQVDQMQLAYWSARALNPAPDIRARFAQSITEELLKICVNRVLKQVARLAPQVKNDDESGAHFFAFLKDLDAKIKNPQAKLHGSLSPETSGATARTEEKSKQQPLLVTACKKVLFWHRTRELAPTVSSTYSKDASPKAEDTETLTSLSTLIRNSGNGY